MLHRFSRGVPSFWGNFFFLPLFLFGFLSPSVAQEAVLKGKILDSKKNPAPYVLVYVENSDKQAYTDSLGNFTFTFPSVGEAILCVKPLGGTVWKKKISLTSGVQSLAFQALENENVLQEVVVQDQGAYKESMIAIDPKQARFLPSPFQDFNKLLASMPGVSSNNELTSNYSVRGGNYDENLVYVNDMEIYRPQLVRQGQQEGLSFVNPDLAGKVGFSTGGWKAMYGDKLGSVLAVDYKKPDQWGGVLSLGLLGYSLALEGATKNQRISGLVGFREKNSRYLLTTLPTQGQYLPRFNDLQSLITIKLGKKEDMDRTQLQVLQTFAWNTYFIAPSTQETNFGTLGQSFKLKVAFVGTEQLKYDTYQGSIKLSHRFSNKHRAFFLGSYVNSFEREYNNVEAGYRLCELLQDFSTQFGNNRCSFTQDLGTYFNYARNSLNVRLFSGEFRNTYIVNKSSTWISGVKLSQENVDDRLYEYGFRDSANYVTSTGFVDANHSISSLRGSVYSSWEQSIGQTSVLSLGLRGGWWSLNQQWLISPTLLYVWQPKWKREVSFKLASGIYRQPPFYREMRGFDGTLNTQLKAQSAWSSSLGMELALKLWKRDFKLLVEGYYKYLWDVVPYDIDNVRIRYYAQNNAIAYATGLDVRLSGEFIKSNESWISLGILNTEEKIEGNPRGYMPRPTQQWVTFGMFFQDHIPNNPTWRVFLNLQFGSGLPFGVPNNDQYRNAFTMPSYRRVDIGFSKAIYFENSKFRIANRQPIQSIWLTLEVLNLFGINNTISYLWVKDVNAGQFAVPNTLSQRFINLRGVVYF